MEITKHARRFLSNYKNFKKLAEMEQGNFSIKAEEIINDINLAIERLTPPGKLIIKNWFCSQGKPNPRGKICKELAISIAEYNNIMENSLITFAEVYRNGVLKDL